MWKLQKIANGNLSCENYDLKIEHIDEIKKILNDRFGKKMEEEHIFIYWDCWSGVFIMLNPGFDNYESSNRLIEEIYNYLYYYRV